MSAQNRNIRNTLRPSGCCPILFRFACAAYSESAFKISVKHSTKLRVRHNNQKDKNLLSLFAF
jgi:hypothetical protein